MEWVDVVSPQRIGFICIKIPDLLRRAGGTRGDVALSGFPAYPLWQEAASKTAIFSTWCIKFQSLLSAGNAYSQS
ncbi:hypothetical protein, partial [Yersinia intermedia]|uniref:hypothetical protein n=1 Tax=Yersinia intermedia TaxID=631 RepID=UPI0022FE9145